MMTNKIKDNLDIVLVVSGTIPLTYSYLTRLEIPLLLYMCSIASAIALEVVLIKQVKQTNINIWSTLAITLSTLFLLLISFATFLPNGLLSSGYIARSTYILVNSVLEGLIHGVFSLLLLCTALSKRYNVQSVLRKQHEVTSCDLVTSGLQLTDKEQEVLEAIKDNPDLTNDEIAKVLNLKVSSFYVYKSKLKSKGLL